MSIVSEFRHTYNSTLCHTMVCVCTVQCISFRLAYVVDIDVSTQVKCVCHKYVYYQRHTLTPTHLHTTPSHLHTTPSHPLSVVNESMQRIEEDTPMFHPPSSDATDGKSQTPEESDVSHGVLALSLQ